MLFSIITVSLNAENLILDTLNSALSQSYNDFEIIVKDGGSTDKTLSQIPNDDRIRVICKKDKGIYDGMNQAILEAKGKYLIFMNCGDVFFSENDLRHVAETLKTNKADIVYGDKFSTPCGEWRYPKKLSKRFFYSGTICHQASFISRELFDKIGLYDENLKIASDWKFFLEAKINGAKYLHCNKFLCTFLEGGVTDTEKGRKLCKEERKQVIKEKYNIFERIIYGAIKKIREIFS